MVTVQTDDEVEIFDNEHLRTARSMLEYMGQSARKDVRFVVARRVGTVYGQDKRPNNWESERELVQYALDFANGDTDRSHVKQLLSTGRSKLQPKNADLTPADQVALDHESIEVSARAKRREFLSSVLTDREAAADRTIDRLKQQLQRLWILPRVERVEGSGARIVFLSIMPDLQAFDAYVDSLLLDDERPFGVNLCQCRLSGCERYFLMKKPATGRPQRLYCSSEHMLEAHAQQSGARARKSRAAGKTAKRGSRKPK
jgi:hypothetical protein